MPRNVEMLQPSADWNIHFGEDQCRLTRVFGEGDDRHIVLFEQAGPDEDFGMTLAGPRLGQFKQLITRISLRENNEFPFADNHWGEVVGFGPAAIFSRVQINDSSELPADADGLSGLPQIDLTRAAETTRILFGHGGKAVGFATGDMSPPFQALNACAADFIRAWGLDQEKHKRFKMARWTNEKAIARRIMKHYSAAARNRGEQAIVRMRVIIETDGSVSNCQLIKATEADRIKSQACKQMEKAVFKPALDADGNPMRSFYSTNIIYQIIPANAHG